MTGLRCTASYAISLAYASETSGVVSLVEDETRKLDYM
jgi:hypothetical protein